MTAVKTVIDSYDRFSRSSAMLAHILSFMYKKIDIHINKQEREVPRRVRSMSETLTVDYDVVIGNAGWNFLFPIYVCILSITV